MIREKDRKPRVPEFKPASRRAIEERIASGKDLVVGVWLELPPLAHFRYEGITRLMGFYIEGAKDLPVRFKFYTPSWMKKEVEKFRSELDKKAQARVEVVTVIEKAPSLVRAIEARQAAIRQLKRRYHTALTDPFANLYEQSKQTFFSRLLTYASIYTQRPSSLEKKRVELDKEEAGLGQKVLSSRILHFMKLRELSSMLRSAVNDTSVDVWVCPSPQFDLARHIKKPLALFFPDFVPLDYPEFFEKAQIEAAHRKFSRSTDRADRAICFLSHIAERHIVDGFGYPPERVMLLRHPPVDYSNMLPFLPQGRYYTEASRFEAAEMLREHARTRLWQYRRGETLSKYVDPFLETAPFHVWDYILLSTQYRPYKNILGVIDAVRDYNTYISELERSKTLEGVLPLSRQMKVIVTAHLNLDERSPLADYINEHNLRDVVFSIPGLSPKAHAAAYHCAVASIHPALFEGGVPFTLGEALTVGTPSLIARGAYSLEPVRLGDESHEFLPDLMLFRANDRHELAWKIQKLAENRRHTFDVQWSFFEKWKTRTWGDVASDFTAELANIAEMQVTRWKPIASERHDG